MVILPDNGAWLNADVSTMRRFYREMLRIRLVEDAIADLVEAGEINCPCHLCVGQEAIPVGVSASLGREDYVFGGHRSHGHYLAKGGDLPLMMAEILGKVTGCAKGRGGSMHLVAPEVGILGTVPIVAATIPMAVGTAMASTLRGDGRVSVTFFGDGAVEEGTFHESMNLAASRKAPVLFVCENNSYASHLEIHERRVRDNIIELAGAHGMQGESIDGNDVLAVYQAAEAAVTRAREGLGPTLLECRTYRWRGHVGPSYNLDVGVKRRDELALWRTRDPVARVEQWLRQHGVNDADIATVRDDLNREISDAVHFAKESPLPAAEDLGRYVFAGTGGAR